MRFALVITLCLMLLAGCSSGVTASDSEQIRKDFSQDKYEAAMKKAGRGDELQREKDAAAARGEQGN